MPLRIDGLLRNPHLLGMFVEVRQEAAPFFLPPFRISKIRYIGRHDAARL